MRIDVVEFTLKVTSLKSTTAQFLTTLSAYMYSVHFKQPVLMTGKSWQTSNESLQKGTESNIPDNQGKKERERRMRLRNNSWSNSLAET